jgi:MFS family permease
MTSPDPAQDHTDRLAADDHHAREASWRASLLFGSFLAALVGAVALIGTFIPASRVAPGALGHLADAVGVFTVGALPLAVALMAEWPIDDRLRRLAMPVGLFALVRGGTTAVVGGATFAVIASIAGLWASAPQFFGAGAAVGLWVGAVGALLGRVLERSRGARFGALVVLVVAFAAGIAVLAVFWRLAD